MNSAIVKNLRQKAAALGVAAGIAAFAPAAFAATPVPTPLATASASANQVSAVIGTVQLKKLSGGKAWDAAADSPLADGEKVITGPDSSSTLALVDGSRITIGANSDFRLNQLPSAYRLFKGQADLEVKGSVVLQAGKNSFQTQGSKFSLSYDSGIKKAHLNVASGSVTVSNAAQTQVFSDGQELIISGTQFKSLKTATVSTTTVPATPVSTVKIVVQTTPTVVSTPTIVLTPKATVAPTALATPAPETASAMAAASTQTAQGPSLAPTTENSQPTWNASLGAHYDAWDSNVEPLYDGWEAWSPLSVSFGKSNQFNVYAQTQFSHGVYNGTPDFTLENLGDSQIGGEVDFNSWGMPSALLLSMNIPTGNTSWETKDSGSVVPTEFIDSRYQGRGFGLSAMYAFSAPIYNGSYGLALGYLYSTAFNPSVGDANSENVKLGDSLFVSTNRAWVHSQDEHDVVQASFYYFLPTEQASTGDFEMGPNLNLSYAWENPRGFSWSVGGQYYLPGWQEQPDGTLTPTPHNLFGPRVFLNASYAIGDFSLQARSKYVFANDYPVTDPSNDYDGGGYLVGGGPSFLIHFGKDSSLNLTGSYDYIDAIGLVNTGSGREDAKLNQWGFGTDFEINFE
jgi:hypothetical protein